MSKTSLAKNIVTRFDLTKSSLVHDADGLKHSGWHCARDPSWQWRAISEKVNITSHSDPVHRGRSRDNEASAPPLFSVIPVRVDSPIQTGFRKAGMKHKSSRSEVILFLKVIEISIKLWLGKHNPQALAASHSQRSRVLEVLTPTLSTCECQSVALGASTLEPSSLIRRGRLLLVCLFARISCGRVLSDEADRSCCLPLERTAMHSKSTFKAQGTQVPAVFAL